MKATECILCGAPPPLTKEHIWPRWFSTLWPEQAFDVHTDMPGRGPESHRSLRLDTAVGVLCMDCNNTWGSRLEQDVQPLLEPMSQGRRQVVSVPDAIRVSAWLVLKAACCEYLAAETHRAGTFFTTDQRRYLRGRRRPPASTYQVWAGRYVGSEFPAGRLLCWHSRYVVADDVRPEMYTWTFSMGEALFQVLGIQPTDGWKPTIHGPVSLDDPRRLPSLWPPPIAPFTWAPSTVFDDSGFLGFARRWQTPGNSPASNLLPGPEHRAEARRIGSEGQGPGREGTAPTTS